MVHRPGANLVFSGSWRASKRYCLLHAEKIPAPVVVALSRTLAAKLRLLNPKGTSWELMKAPAKLKIDELNFADDLKPTNPKDITDAIAQEAERIWGKDWFAELVRQYCEIEGRMTGDTPPAKARRSTIERALETGKTTLETTTWLAACVNAQMQLAIHRVEIRKF